MKKPVIAVFGSITDDGESTFLRRQYSDAISFAGGIGLIVPLETPQSSLEQLVSICGGFLFAGGCDVNPALYGQQCDVSTSFRDARDTLDLAAFRVAYDAGLPILGICRGIQLINVALGGSLHQDIPSHVQSEPMTQRTHRVRVNGESRMFGTLGSGLLYVNSSHHQCCDFVPEELEVVCRTDDGIVEGVEARDKKRYLFAVQWHPEYTFADDAASGALFRSFVGAASKRKLQSF